MPKYKYTAITPEGRELSGFVEAANQKAAQGIIAGEGNIPTAIVAAKGGAASKGKADNRSPQLSFGGSVKLLDILLFTKQLNTLMRAGIAITRALEVLEEQSEKPLMKTTIKKIATDILQGEPLSDAFKKHPKVFSKLYCSLVHAGELSGSLNQVLDRVCYILEHENKVREDIKSALAYPKMVLMALGGAFFFLLTFVIPKFVGVFKKAGLELPLPTKMCILMYAFLKSYWYLLIGGVVGTVFIMKLYFKTPVGGLMRDQFLLKLPIIGHLFIKTAMSRFASILAILMTSGVAILDSIKIISDTIGNLAITREFDKVKMQMEEGKGISLPLRRAKYFPPMVVNMIAIGEEAGSLEDMLRELARHYDEEVEYAVKGLSEAIGPILIVGLTAVVGFFAMAIFLPMWDLTKMAK